MLVKNSYNHQNIDIIQKKATVAVIGQNKFTVNLLILAALRFGILVRLTGKKIVHLMIKA